MKILGKQGQSGLSTVDPSILGQPTGMSEEVSIVNAYRCTTRGYGCP